MILPNSLCVAVFVDSVTLARPPLRLPPFLLILLGVLVPLPEDGCVRAEHLPLHNFIEAHRFFTTLGRIGAQQRQGRVPVSFGDSVCGQAR